VAFKVAQKQVTDMHYEARIQCIINWYAEYRWIQLTKADARKVKYFEPWQYMQVNAYRLLSTSWLSSLVSLSVYFLSPGDSSVLQCEEAVLREDGSVVDLPCVLEEARRR
jgi:hypothetical protein